MNGALPHHDFTHSCLSDWLALPLSDVLGQLDIFEGAAV